MLVYCREKCGLKIRLRLKLELFLPHRVFCVTVKRIHVFEELDALYVPEQHERDFLVAAACSVHALRLV